MIHTHSHTRAYIYIYIFFGMKAFGNAFFGLTFGYVFKLYTLGDQSNREKNKKKL